MVFPKESLIIGTLDMESLGGQGYPLIQVFLNQYHMAFRAICLQVCQIRLDVHFL